MKTIFSVCALNKFRLIQSTNGFGLLNLLFLSPVISGSFSELARAGGSSSLPIHYAIAVLVFIMIWTSLQLSVSIGIILMYTYLVFMGLIRRSLIPTTGYLSNDPIILISTFVSTIYFIRMLLNKSIPRYTKLSKSIFMLVTLMFIEVFNPFQGGIVVGVSGILFYMVPIFWYYIGFMRGNMTTLAKLFVCIVIIGLFEALIGFNQTQNGLSEVEMYWSSVAGGGTQTLGASGVRRSFGTFLSFSEYVISLVIGCSISWVMFLRRKYAYLIPFILLFVAVFISSSRTGMITLLFAIVISWALQGENIKIWLPRVFIALIIGILGLNFGLDKVEDVNIDDKTSVLVNHEISGLKDPFSKNSSSHTHINLITGAVISGFKMPIGYGLGSTTLASKKFASNATEFLTSAENDYANMFSSLGFIGGILYLVVHINIWTLLICYWKDTRETNSLIMIIVLAAGQGQWLLGAHYAQSMFFWFAIGTFDKVFYLLKNKTSLLITEKSLDYHQ